MPARVDRGPGADQSAREPALPGRAARVRGIRERRAAEREDPLRHAEDPLPDVAGAIRAVVAAAKKLGARVVADSVETVAQESALTALGVEIVQGYLYGPEVAPAELRTLITRPE